MNAETHLRRTKIVATLGPATDPPGMLVKLIAEGVDVVRLNLSHGQPQDHRARAMAVREAAQAAGREVGILADLQGPKIRIEKFAHGPIELHPGDPFVLDCSPDAPPGDSTRVGVSYHQLPQDVAAGDVLLLDDGLVALRVVAVEGAQVRCEVLIGGKLSDRKGLNRQGGGLSVSALSDKDRADIQLAAEIGADFLAVSFVRPAADMEQARRLLREADGHGALVAKIERADAIPVLGEIIDASDAVMVARGDLGVEMPLESVPGLQKQITRAARKAGKPVVVATQMLESMIHAPMPTRAEVSDVATAVFDGADAVMLSAESASGEYPVEAVETMNRIACAIESDELYQSFIEAQRGTPDKTTPDAIMAAVHAITETIEARAILCWSTSGRTALRAARERPRAPIIAATPSLPTARRMTLVWGTHPVVTPDINSVDEMVGQAIAIAVKEGFAVQGDDIVVTAGIPFGRSGGTNMLRVAKV